MEAVPNPPNAGVGVLFVAPKANTDDDVVVVVPNAGAEIVVPNAGAEVVVPKDGAEVVVPKDGVVVSSAPLPNTGVVLVVLLAPNAGVALPNAKPEARKKDQG